MSKQLITIDRPGMEASAVAEATTKRDQALAVSKKITQVTTADEQEEAVKAAQVVKGFYNEIEKVREEIKRPVIDLGKKIEAIANELKNPADAEYKRVMSLVGDFQQREKARIEAETRRIQAEAAEAQRQLDAARVAREQAEARAASLKTKAAREKALADAAEARAKEAEKELELAESTPVPVTPAAPSKVAGATIKQEYDFEVLDIHALYKARPDLVKLEAIRSEVKIHIAYGQQLPGLRVFPKVSASARGVATSLTLPSTQA